ncbi:MAG: FeoB-associated Cys-rich membrane protein [Anaerolineaceae bacterium]|nr:FeoB-associated Cys-rich membrane protein [Anaerolineaceae bacterium]
MNIFDILILAAVAAAVFFAVRRLRKNKGTCGCGCADCPHKKGCQKL